MENNINNENQKYRVSFGIDRADEKKVQDLILNLDCLEDVEFNDLGFIATLKYDDIRIVSGKLIENSITLFSIMRKGAK